MGFSPDLKTATEMAVRNMIEFLVSEEHLSRDDAYMLTSVAVDVDITQLVDGNVGVHALCPERHLRRCQAAIHSRSFDALAHRMGFG